ncbi:hypothetical protein [Marinomonas piezotolerans]|nr:hypothetical protein [Marinomonas piezotolerans]
MTYQIKVQTGDQIKGASVSDAQSQSVAEAIADQLSNWGNRLIEIRMGGKRIYPSDEEGMTA